MMNVRLNVVDCSDWMDGLTVERHVAKSVNDHSVHEIDSLASSSQINLCPVKLTGRLVIFSWWGLGLDSGVSEVGVFEVQSVLRFDGGAFDPTLDCDVITLLHVGRHQNSENDDETVELGAILKPGSHKHMPR